MPDSSVVHFEFEKCLLNSFLSPAWSIPSTDAPLFQGLAFEPGFCRLVPVAWGLPEGLRLGVDKTHICLCWRKEYISTDNRPEAEGVGGSFVGQQFQSFSPDRERNKKDRGQQIHIAPLPPGVIQTPLFCFQGDGHLFPVN